MQLLLPMFDRVFKYVSASVPLIKYEPNAEFGVWLDPIIGEMKSLLPLTTVLRHVANGRAVEITLEEKPCKLKTK